MNKKLFLAAVLLFAGTLIYAQGYTQKSLMSVMGSKSEAQVEFGVSEKTDASLLLTVNGFSYKNKTVGEFTLTLNSYDDGNIYSAKNVVVQAEGKDKPTVITVIECSLTFTDENLSPVLKMKYKPGKMPFAISLMRAD